MATQCLNLSTLPPELIGAIFDELRIDHALYLTFVARRFWEIGWPYMEKKLLDILAPWAGHRLICLGLGSAYDSDYQNILTGDEKEEMKQGLTPDEYDEMDLEGPFWFYPSKPVSLSAIVSWRYMEIKVKEDPLYFQITRLLSKIIRVEQRRNKLQCSVTMNIPDYFPDDRKWVLRNLTTHEFVRSEVVAGNSKQNGPFFEDLGFEHIVLSRIFWSSEPSTDGRSLERGIWAGHRFEIITVDHHTKPTRSEVAWKDISEEAVEDLIQISRASGYMSGRMRKPLIS